MLDPQKVTLISEIGINHNGDLQIAKRLIDASFACGWDCVKFQKRTPDLCVPEKQKSIMRQTPWGLVSYLDYKKKLEFSEREYRYIDAYCKTKPIPWTASIWDLPSLDFICKFDVPFLKLPSALITNLELVIEAARTQIQIVISTGMSTLQQIDDAVNHILMHSDKKPVIMHCNSEYPCPHKNLNLKMIPVLRKRYDCIIGYSGHEQDLEPTVVAVVLGAKVIERHITIDHEMFGTDQGSSLSITAMDMLKGRITAINDMLGDGIKKVTEGEKKILEKLRGC